MSEAKKLYEVQFGSVPGDEESYSYSYWDLDVAERTYDTYRDGGWKWIKLQVYTVTADEDGFPVIEDPPRIIKSHGLEETTVVSDENTRLTKLKECHGKTIDRIDNSCVNQLTIHFTDGTFIAVETTHFGMGLYGFEVVEY